MDNSIENKNLELYEKFRSVPETAKKKIQGGRLKGMTDINPMWRIKTLTEKFGPCGIGWKYTIKEKRLEHGANGEISAFVEIELFIKYNDQWSEPIPGIGGSSFVSNEKNGAFTSDECVDGDCEVLTPKGWIKFKNYNGFDEIAQFNKETDQISFVKPINFISKVSFDTYKKGNIIMTGGHRNLIERRSKSAKEKRFVDIAENIASYSSIRCNKPRFQHKGRSKSFKDIRCGYFGEEKELTIMQKIGIMIACDATLYYDGSEYNTWRAEFVKERKIEKARKILTESGIEFKEEIHQRNFGKQTTSFTFKTDKTNYKNYKTFLPIGNYKNIKQEILDWDGCVKNATELFFSTNYDNIEYLQTLCAMSGVEASLYVKRDRGENHSDIYTLYFRKRKKSMTEIVPYKGPCKVYCVEVPDTFFLIKKEGEILVTGNCFKMALTDAISVSCKALGLGADVYFEKDRTKYDENENTPIAPPTIDEKRIVVYNYMNKNIPFLQKVLKAYCAGSMEDLTNEHIDVVYSTLKMRKQI